MAGALAVGAVGLAVSGNDIFGSEGSPAQVVDTTPPEFVELRPDVAESVQSFIGGEQGFIGSPIQQEQAQFATPITPNEQATINALQQQTGQLAPTDIAARNEFLATVGGAGFDNPHLQGAIDAAVRPLVDTFNQVTLPGLKSDFTRRGQVIRPGEPAGRASSPFNQAAAIAQTGLLNNIGDITSRLSFENFNQERNRQTQAARDLSGLRTEDVNLLLDNLKAQALPRLIEELGLERALDEFNKFTDNILAALNIGGTISSGGSVTLPAIPGTPGLVESFARSAVGNFGGGVGTAASTFLPTKKVA